jgi:hypothetical protein
LVVISKDIFIYNFFLLKGLKHTFVKSLKINFFLKHIFIIKFSVSWPTQFQISS